MSLYTPNSAHPMRFRLRPLLASSPPCPAESSSSSYRPPVRFRLLSTPLRSDAVSFGYGVLAFPDTDFYTVLCGRLHGRTRSGLARDWPRFIAGKPAPTASTTAGNRLKGTAGLLVEAHRRMLISGVRPRLLELRAAGYFIADSVIAAACQAVGEEPVSKHPRE